MEQVTAILDGKRILGNPNEIREVQNAYAAYEFMLNLDALSVDDLLRDHAQMMDGLVRENGRFRSGGVGVFNGKSLVHMAPPAKLVPEHIHNLFAWYRQSELHPLVKSAVFHYEFEFIHPFSDGNGRMGRMWHSLLLAQWKELFFWLPVEELIQVRQKEYYDALGIADAQADSAGFVELMLEIIRDSLQEISVVGRRTDQDSDQDRTPVERLLIALGSETLSTAALMKHLLLCFLHKIEVVARLFRATASSRPTQKEPCRGRSSATVLFYSKPYSSSFSSPGCSMFHLSLRRVKRAGTSTVSLS